jgi:hypothetical protein
MMFCPLCKYEYRDRFTEYSDCHSKLVYRRAEAEREAVVFAWKGSDKKKLDRVLDAFRSAEILLRFKESMELDPVSMYLGSRSLGAAMPA